MKTSILSSIVLMLMCTQVNAQRVGIGTTTPAGRLEVKGIGTTSGSNTFILKNSNGDTLLRMRDDGRMGIGYNGSTYGRQVNIQGIGINFYSGTGDFGGAVFPTDTSLILWSNSNVGNHVIFQPSWGNTGIGTYSPKAKFHLRDGSSAIVPLTHATMIIESDTAAILNLLGRAPHSSGIQFGNGANSAHGSILYNHSGALNGLSFRTTGITRMVVADNGEVGINTNTPSARLDVNGSINASSEIRRTPTGTANMVPICYGSVSPGAPPTIQSGTGNFTVTNSAVGYYEITITSENYSNSGHTTLVTPVSSSFRTVSTNSSGNSLVIRIFNSAFDLVDTYFHFVVFQN